MKRLLSLIYPSYSKGNSSTVRFNTLWKDTQVGGSKIKTQTLAIRLQGLYSFILHFTASVTPTKKNQTLDQFPPSNFPQLELRRYPEIFETKWIYVFVNQSLQCSFLLWALVPLECTHLLLQEALSITGTLNRYNHMSSLSIFLSSSLHLHEWNYCWPPFLSRFFLFFFPLPCFSLSTFSKYLTQKTSNL